MTGSFTSMLLSGILISKIHDLHLLESQVEILSNYGRKVLEDFSTPLKNVANLPFKRAVFLGSGIFQGIARESHLKLQELTDGKIICKFDTFLGFRHGPKAVIDPETLMVYLFSNRTYAHWYEIDLVKSIYNGQKGIFGIGVSETELKEISPELSIVFNSGHPLLEEDFLTPVSVLPAQMLGFFKSLAFNLEPDHPSKSGTITRVVQGVKLYPYSKEVEKA